MNGHRKAALALHRVAPEDRRIVLDELHEQDRAVLRGYLDELDALGFDAAVVEETLAKPAPAGARGVIHGAGVPALVSVLGAEPASLVVALLRLEPWPWTDPFLRALPPAQRLRVAAALAGPAAPAAPARDALLLEQVAAALRATPVSEPEPFRRSFLGNVKQWVTKWPR